MNPSFSPNVLRTAVKDRLREARYFAREFRDTALRAGRGAVGEANPASAMLGTLTQAADQALTRLESLALDVVSIDADDHRNLPAAHPLGRYFSARPTRGRELFGRDIYFAAKRILIEKGAGNPVVREQAIGKAYGAVTADLAAIGIDPAGADLGDLCLAAAVLARALAGQKLVAAPRRIDEPAGEDGDAGVDAGAYVAFAIALGLAVASFRDGRDDEGDIFGAAMAAVDIRYPVLEAGLNGPEPIACIARAFQELTPHLP